MFALARVHVGRGPRAVEELLLGRLAELAAQSRREPGRLAAPVRVVVPSSVLAGHLGARAVSRLGALAGVRVQTLFSLALDLLAPLGVPPPRGGAAFPVLVRRFAAATPRLGRELAGLEDGFAAVEGAVRDLLDAGFEAAHVEAVIDRLRGLRESGLATPVEIERAVEVARVARASAEGMAAYGLARHADLYGRAAEALAADPSLLLSRAVLLHGIANATGQALDLLGALARFRGAELFLDLPPAPLPAAAGGAVADAGHAFAGRLVERLTGRPVAELAPECGRGEGEGGTARVFVAAPGPWAEARESVRRARRWIEEGVAPESIGIVARDLARYRLPLRQAAERLGVPISAPGLAGVPGERERRLAALAAVLRGGPRVPVDAWLEACGGQPGGEGEGSPVEALELRVGLRALGAVRLGDVATLEPDGRDLALPVRRGEQEDDADRGDADRGDAGGDHQGASGAPPPRGLSRRRLRASTLRAAVRSARRLVELFERAPGRGGGERGVREPLRAHRGWLDRVLATLGRPPGDDPARLALGRLAAELPEDLPLSAVELALLAGRALEQAAAPVLGGSGGGVRLLSAAEARGCTFERLLVLGLNREIFPRRIEEDPLLPDPLRRALTGLLPDLPVKSDGHAEERYLFAQLLAAAPSVTLSWCATDDDGNPATPSPLVEALRRTTAAEPERPSAFTPASLLEQATAAALVGGQSGLAELLAPALAASPGCHPRLGAVRSALLAELEPDLEDPRSRRLSPLLGLCGRRASGEAVSVTTLESLARCSWRTLLERELRLALPPDPLADLGDLDGLLVGEVVHAYLEAVAGVAGVPCGGLLPEVLGGRGAALAWPAGAEREALLGRVAAAVARAEGVPLLARPLAERSRAYLARAERELAAGLPLLGAEVAGELAVGTGDAARRLRFRADLVERHAGGLLLTDLKTGRVSPALEAKKVATRRRRLLREIAGGERLQAMAYALAGAGAGARGRYLFLGAPEDAEVERNLELAPDDAELAGAFHHAVTTLLAALDAGAFVPRLLDASLEEEGPACRFCAVREACRQGDSVVTRRFARWAEGVREGAEAGAPAAALAVLRLGAAAAPGEELP